MTKSPDKLLDQESVKSYMSLALSLAERGRGETWPNPAVGCVIVNNDQIVGRGWTQPGGRPHAETMAIKQAGIRAKNASVFVTLEPCSHQGETAPCAEAIISAGIKNVYVACLDPDYRVSGSGLEMLRQANIKVQSGISEKLGKNKIEGYLARQEFGRPTVTVKLATTLDGKIATKHHQSKWITGESALAFSHMLRSKHDSIMVGSGTIIADDPQLTCRLPGITNVRRPRIILDGRLRLPTSSHLMSNVAEAPIWLVTDNEVPEKKIMRYSRMGIEIIQLESKSNIGFNLFSLLEVLGNRGLNSVLVEGGQLLATSFMEANLVDSLAWFHAPKIIGDDGLSSIGSLKVELMSQVHKYEIEYSKELNGDHLTMMRKVK
ncbi:MAG: bifunctional diaminohydroxyphosphoribosylaminopyrimidine deaminase/5-amino-6-(5-phosphoribosylamino)uracil reductase RibD [Pseudomonadota bacterium]|nr:bifunctional diaminohydroxyphosphoribosylaminopyrimidine deaminase/5-amino-6-(5-phosphoribosylamino)uracil reductase RibD [Pseudomonadota bacterium]